MADNARFHNKLHRKNHHSVPTEGYPDSATDPIASRDEPFNGDFIVNASISAHNNLYVDNDATILGNLSVYGDFAYFETIVSITSALSVVNIGTGPALTVVQSGPQPIARFIDGDAPVTGGRYAFYINDKGESVFGWDSVGPVRGLSGFRVGIVDNTNKPFLIEEYQNQQDGATVRGLHSRGTVITPAGLSAGDILLGLRGYGMLEGGNRPTQSAPASINFRAAERFTSTGTGTFMTFGTTPSGSINIRERMRIENYGHVGINTTEPIEARLTISGDISASNALSAERSFFWGYVSAGELRAYYTNSNHVTANYIFGYENESIFTDGFNLSGNGNGTLTINYTNGLYVSSAPVHFALATQPSRAVFFGRDSSANLYRLQQSTLKTDGNLVVSGALSAGATNYDTLITRGVSAIATDPNFHLLRGRLGINTIPLSTFGIHLRGGNIRVDGVDYSGLPGFNGTVGGFDTDGQSLFDLRSASPGANYNLSIASSGIEHFMKLFGGRDNDPNPFIVVKTGEPLRFASFSNFYNNPNTFVEHMRVDTQNSRVGINTQTPGATLTVAGAISGNSWLSAGNVVLQQADIRTFVNPATATGDFLVLNINGTNRALRLWNFTN